jgi:hypothetical protein
MARRVLYGRIHFGYALCGPTRSRALRVCRGDQERADQICADWEEWRDRYRLAWSRGKAVPPPPHQELFIGVP